MIKQKYKIRAAIEHDLKQHHMKLRIAFLFDLTCIVAALVAAAYGINLIF